MQLKTCGSLVHRTGRARQNPFEVSYIGSSYLHLKFLRGSALDPFGHTDERRRERQWITDYRSAMEEVMQGLTPDRMDAACEIARIAQDVRGFGHVKERHQAAAARKLEGLLAQWRS